MFITPNVQLHREKALSRSVKVPFFVSEKGATMKIIEKKIQDLKPYENNPRMNENAVEKVAQSIEAYGFKVPLVIDKNNVVVCGHTRLKAAMKLKMETLPCVVADDLSPDQVRAFRLADNKTSDFSIWDNKKLLIELDNIGGKLFTGFETSDFFDDVNSLTEVEQLDEADKSVLEQNDIGVEYKLIYKTCDKKMIDAIKDFIESHEGITNG